MRTQNLVTVLMSMYNTPEEQLRQAIESILNQTYTNFEFLIIDDATKDNGVEIVKSYKDKRIRIEYNKSNLGLEKSLNRGLELAKSDYVIRMDTDDIAYPNRIQKQIEFSSDHPEYSIISSRADFFDENGIYGTSKRVGEVKRSDFLYGVPFIHPTICLKRSDVLKAGGYPLYTRCEDYAMEANMYVNGYKGYVMEDVLLKYRLDTNGYKKKKFKYRLNEYKVKEIYLKRLGFPWYERIPYVIKPLIAGLTPNLIMRKFHHNKLS
jgi:glycosyltransferase EpsE